MRHFVYKLRHALMLQDVMEEWAICQKSWLYLEPIFSSDDIMRQLPVEGKRYQTMDRMWRKIMMAAKQDPKASVQSRLYIPVHELLWYQKPAMST